ncbi:hypothetical protein ABID65_007658 [Bradyrhizobium sp. S3.9.2]|uniref:hypothetical protein n=1 Tax=unclassified Bradyrhizobium TaxID=2631580 RepID=UPI0033912DB1
MAEYQLTTEDANGPVQRAADHACIPNDPANRDWAEYQAWLADGGVPDPYVPPAPVPPMPTVEDQVLFDHENRIRAMEGLPPLSLDEFIAKMRGEP